jgi:hypothetical protein
MIRLSCFAILLALSQFAAGQTMYKCQNAGGKTEYSDRECLSGVTVKRLTPSGGPTPEDRARAQMRVAAELDRFAVQEQIDDEARRANRAARASGDASIAPASAQDNEKLLIHGKAGWDRKTRAQIAAEQTSRASRQQSRGTTGASGAPGSPSAPEAPTPTTNCDASGCWDTAGRRYNSAGSSPMMFRTDGKVCQQIGANMHCN